MSERPRRVIKERALTYWEEWVQTDAWYVKKIVDDVPEEELQAALMDEDFEEDGECEGESGDETEDSMDTEDDDIEYIPPPQDSDEITELSDTSSENDATGEEGESSDSDDSDDACSTDDSEEEEVLGPGEGERRGQEAHGGGPCGTVGEGGPSAGPVEFLGI